MNKLTGTIGFLIVIFSLTTASIQAAPTAESEMAKVVEAVAPLRVFAVDVIITLSGDYFKDKPNFPRSGNLTIAVNAPSKEKADSGAKLVLTTVKGPMTFGLANLGQKLYLSIITPEGRNGYFFDREKSEMKKEKQMLNGILSGVKGTLSIAEKDPGKTAVAQVESKGTLSLPVPGMLKIVDKKNSEKVLTIKYDKTSYLPQIINFRDNKDGIRGSLLLRNWRINRDINVALPLPLAQYKAFGKDSVGTIIQALPKPQEVLSSEPITVSMVKPTATGLSTPAPGASPTDELSGNLVTPSMQRDLKQTVTELKNVVEILKDPKFQRSLNRASNLLKRLETQLDRMEKLQK